MLTKNQKNMIYESLSRFTTENSTDEDIVQVVESVVGQMPILVEGGTHKKIVIGEGREAFTVSFLLGGRRIEDQGSLLLG